jgi:hypothetical protein
MGRILSDAEMIELTGYQVPGKQLEVLRAMGLRPVIRPDGRPRITDDALTQAMLGHLPAENSGPVVAPDFTALRRRA